MLLGYGASHVIRSIIFLTHGQEIYSGFFGRPLFLLALLANRSKSDWRIRWSLPYFSDSNRSSRMNCRTLEGVTPRYLAASSVVNSLPMRKNYTTLAQKKKQELINKGKSQYSVVKEHILEVYRQPSLTLDYSYFPPEELFRDSGRWRKISICKVWNKRPDPSA